MEVQKTERPLAAGVEGSLNGTLTIHTVVPLEEHQTKEGVFAFVLYYHQTRPFTQSLYYSGILSYLECVKRGGRFANWSVVVYTDKASIEVLQTAFPFETYPMLVLCIVDWPAFTDSNGLPSPEMLRCLRFQSAELFPTQICCIRDADTVFQSTLFACYSKPEEITEFSKALEQWEATFVDTWLGTELIQRPIVIGSDIAYSKDWHSNFPAPVPWRTPPFYSAFHRISMFNTANSIKDVIRSPLGMFAGFVNFASDKSSFPDLWTQCVRYLGERYTMVRGGFENEYKRIISNKHSQGISGGIVGKDEKILIFVIARLYFDRCFFFPIQYNAENGDKIRPGGYIAQAFTKNEHYNHYPGYYISLLEQQNRKVQYHVVPPIKVCGRLSGMLNPEYIRFVLTDAKTSITNEFTVEAITHSVPAAIQHMMAEFYTQYESWLSKINIPTFLEKMKKLEKGAFIELKNPKSYGIVGVSAENFYNRRINSPRKLEKLFKEIPKANIIRLAASEDLDDMFLKQVGPYSPAEEEEFKLRLNSERQVIINAKRAEHQAFLEEERLREEMWLKKQSKGGYHHRKTRKHRRFTKKRKATTRRRT